VLASVFLMVQIGVNDPGFYLYASGLLVVGFVLYAANRLLKRRLDTPER
jgi:hypothetical protein